MGEENNRACESASVYFMFYLVIKLFYMLKACLISVSKQLWYSKGKFFLVKFLRFYIFFGYFALVFFFLGKFFFVCFFGHFYFLNING